VGGPPADPARRGETERMPKRDRGVTRRRKPVERYPLTRLRATIAKFGGNRTCQNQRLGPGTCKAGCHYGTLVLVADDLLSPCHWGQ
jgi:hypothetical protein